MKLSSVSFINREQEWEFEKVDLFDLTLLVGVSGVGKTQILKAIYKLTHIANGSSENGAKWEVEFQTLKGNKYTWKGEFETLNSNNNLFENFLEDETEKVKPKIINEVVLLNDLIIVERDSNKFTFNNVEMPKLISTESAIHILKEEELIKDAYDSFKLILFRDHTQKEGIRFGNLSIEKLKGKYQKFEDIKESDLDTLHKLALTYDISKETFDEIKERFIDVFPQIEDIKVEPIRDNEFSNFIFEATVIQIKETNVNRWIPQNRISSGMLRTLMHIAEMYLWSEGTVILIDEFENSLGLNCIDVLTEDLVYENNNIQFIATSHHPYIINKIPYDYWKIVTRKGSKIKTFDTKDFDMGKSHHDRFMSLINHPFYKQGIS
jgi:ABC-type transport system involved in cytochrome c biogenesis ATPase subunit